MTEKIHLTDFRILIDCKFLIGSFFIIFKNSQQIPNLAMITHENNTGAYSIKFEHISGNHFTPWSFSFFHISRNKSRKYPIIGNNLSEEIGEPKEKPYGTENKTIDSICTQSEHSMNKNSNNGKRK